MFFALLLACTVDENGDSCSIFATVTDGEDLYCIDDNAPAACEQVLELMIASFEECLGRRFDEEEARAAAEDAIACEDAVATTADLEDCILDLTEPECGADGVPVMPATCDGAVLVTEG